MGPKPQILHLKLGVACRVSPEGLRCGEQRPQAAMDVSTLPGWARVHLRGVKRVQSGMNHYP